jgi:hypothetical protein
MTEKVQTAEYGVRLIHKDIDGKMETIGNIPCETEAEAIAVCFKFSDGSLGEYAGEITAYVVYPPMRPLKSGATR